MRMDCPMCGRGVVQCGGKIGCSSPEAYCTLGGQLWRPASWESVCKIVEESVHLRLKEAFPPLKCDAEKLLALVAKWRAAADLFAEFNPSPAGKAFRACAEELEKEAR